MKDRLIVEDGRRNKSYVHGKKIYPLREERKKRKEKKVQTQLKSELNTDLNTQLIWNEPLITGTPPDRSGSRQNQRERGRDRPQSIGKRPCMFQTILEILQRTR